MKKKKKLFFFFFFFFFFFDVNYFFPRSTDMSKTELKNSKSELNELCLKEWNLPPTYSWSKSVEGMFVATVALPHGNGSFSGGPFSGLKAAEIDAARVALASLAKPVAAPANPALSSASASASPTPAASTAAIAAPANPVVVPSAVPVDSVALASAKHRLVLDKMLDLFRRALLRPLRDSLVAVHGANWLKWLKAVERKLPEAVRTGIDEKLMNWDVVAGA